ncbi:sirohydrochlorin cobaltochelatase [Marinifilum caeruleilacunae]|uniref:Sirohydrochlorin cobaltochelatase n=1 Tax=Marinifilum caeruleilacunae TaxID=2499076 RepID=A0ABX1WQL7_9BACT|nr:sirohydrochlorin cobaltochelatase [Marinifilum caeruleilacunae]NOU58374.1 sirohydrochlorin cobaltochelatase [Marinifilum caeruleilacunae]
MNLIKRSAIALCALAMVFTGCSDDDNDDKNTLGDKDGILLVTFGSSFPDPQKTFEKIDLAAKERFSGETIKWGFTSDIIINKLRQGNGEGSLNGTVIDNDTPEEALEIMVKEGFSKFEVQSLHVIPGEEFDELEEAIQDFKMKYEGVEVKVGRPLLDSDADIKKVAEILAAKFANEITEGPVLFMGHGTPHAADAQYLKLQSELQKLNANFFVGTVEGIGFDAGTTSIGGILAELDKLSPKANKVTITPLMSIAGDHANNDMNGNTGETDPAEQSWKERLEAKSYTVNTVMKGLGDYDEINDIWMDHLEGAE